MTVFELKIALIQILAEESGPEVDWDQIENLSERTYVRLTEPDTPQDFPQESVIGYLGGFRRRRGDRQFCEQQREWLRMYLQG